YNRDRLYERYEKWKNKTHTERQNILILNQQILALHNNPLLNMADARRLSVLKLM
ncbi:42186_t:CDS:1, partial [Gigaspora margarita]